MRGPQFHQNQTVQETSMTQTDFTPRKGMTATEIAETVDAVIAQATAEEKVAMMSGRGFFGLYAASGKRWGADPYPAGSGCERLGIPPLYFTDGPRGVARGNSTCFPCVMARGASFDVDLERRIGEAMSIEIRAQGCTLSGAVCVNLLRHPAWGRAQETYGEDTYHLGEMGAALAQGLQHHNVIATVKHFALNSMENARFKVDVRCDDRTMREVYLPHFKRILDAGCASVMSAYNKWNGAYCGEHRELLTTILREEWGFTGFVHSDWVFGVRTLASVEAGLDVENPEPMVFGKALESALETGEVSREAVDTACRRILTTQYRFAAAADPLPAYTMDLVSCEQHRDLAKEAAEKSAVLLKNAGVLPLNRASLKSLAVIGRLAALENTGDHGSSRVRPAYVVTALEGLRAMCGDAIALHAATEEDLGAVEAAARASDAVIAVVGYTAEDEGEYIPGDGINLGDGATEMQNQIASQSQMMNARSIGGDRRSLELPADQIAMLKAAARAGKPIIVVIVAGSAVLVETWIDDANAVLQTFYSGMEGGRALARIVFGEVSPSARLPFTVARQAQDYPFLDIDADSIIYGPYAGYTHFDKSGAAPRFSFGHGLSYAHFAYGAAYAKRINNETLEVGVQVTSESVLPADHVVLVFAHPPGVAAERPQRVLKAFARESFKPGETKTVSALVRIADLKWWNPASRAWELEAGDYAFSMPYGAQVATTTLSL